MCFVLCTPGQYKMVLRVETGEDNVPFVQLGECQLRLDLEDLNEEYQERARNELRETPEIVERALLQFREYILSELFFIINIIIKIRAQNDKNVLVSCINITIKKLYRKLNYCL